MSDFTFFLQCMKVKSEREVAQSCPTLRDPIHELQPTRLHRPWDFPARVLEWGAVAFSYWGHRINKLQVTRKYVKQAE